MYEAQGPTRFNAHFDYVCFNLNRSWFQVWGMIHLLKDLAIVVFNWIS